MALHRRGNFAVYQGKEYKAHAAGKGLLRLFSRDPADVGVGFTPDSRGGLVKDVARDAVQEYFSRYISGMYQGHEVDVTQEWDGKLLITLPSRVPPEVRHNLGFTEAERGVYEKWVGPDELERVWEVKEPL